jgi:hypothetical protein
VSEANLLDVAHEASPYEDVVSVGLFQPADRVGAGRQVPRWSLVAVTESKVHIFAVRSVVPYVTVSHPRLFATLDRKTTVARAADSVLVLEDVEAGREFRFDRAAGQGEYVLRELQAQPAES